MANDMYIGANSGNYSAMACHVFALSADPAAMTTTHNTYTLLGDYMAGLEIPDFAANNPNPRWRTAIENAVYEEEASPQEVMNRLREEFGFNAGPANRAPFKLWGLFGAGQYLPEHMWFTAYDKIYDTMPNSPVRRASNMNGLNPPSETYKQAPTMCFSTPIQALTGHQLQIVQAKSYEWRVER